LELNIEILCANSSQAKGRVERVNRTLQDRLVKEMRLAGVSGIEAGNAFLADYIARFNGRFAIDPYRAQDLHRPLEVSRERLRDILCHREMRHVGQQLTVAYDRKMFILARNEITEGLVGHHIEVYHYADERLDLRWNGVSLPYAVLDKEQRVTQAAVIENKRLGSALALVRTMQERERPAPRVKTNSEAVGYRPRPPRRAGLRDPAAGWVAAAE